MELTKFLKTGEIANIFINMNVVELKKVIGQRPFKKKQLIDENEDNTYLIYFKEIEICILNNRVHSITVDLDANVFTLLHKFEIKTSMSFDLILRFLDFAEIKWELCQKYCYNKEVSIITEGGVILGCVYDPELYWISKLQKLSSLDMNI
jgi:hypothetical protein